MKPTASHIRLALGFAILAIVTEACAPKIQGARPHRRDRHCGCEFRSPEQNDTLCYITQKTN